MKQKSPLFIAWDNSNGRERGDFVLSICIRYKSLIKRILHTLEWTNSKDTDNGRKS